MKTRDTDLATSHISTFSQVLSKVSSQGINFKEEVKGVTLELGGELGDILHDFRQQLSKAEFG